MSDSESKTITKRELVQRLAERTGLTKMVLKDIVQQFLDEIVGELARGNRIEFREFGVFEVRERAARIAQNPRTLEKVEIPARRVVKFKIGRTMQARVCANEGYEPEDEAAELDDEPESPPRRAPPASQPPYTPPKPPPPSNSPF